MTGISLCVYCGSRAGNDPAYARAATDMGTQIGRAGGQLVYGGGRAGLMGLVADAALAFVKEHAGNAPLVFSTAEPAQVVAVQDEFGQEAVARATEALFGELARCAVAAGVRRLVVAGGETSGAVVKALGLRALAIGPEIAPGVPALLATIDGSALALALKSGNFGDGDFFTTAIAMLGGEDV